MYRDFSRIATNPEIFGTGFVFLFSRGSDKTALVSSNEMLTPITEKCAKFCGGRFGMIFFSDLSMCVSGWLSEYPSSMNAC